MSHNTRKPPVIINLHKLAPDTYTVQDPDTTISFSKSLIYGQQIMDKSRPIRMRQSTYKTQPEPQKKNSDKKPSEGQQSLNNGNQIKQFEEKKPRPDAGQPVQVQQPTNKHQMPLIQAPPALNDPQQEHKQQVAAQIVANKVIQPFHHLIYKEQFLKNWEQIIPGPSRWFSIDSIHQIEKEALPEFFPEFFLNQNLQLTKNAKSPRLYKHYRNKIIERWMVNPKGYLKITECIQNIPGDASALIRVYLFLEHWGLINISVPATSLITNGSLYQLNHGIIEKVKANFSLGNVNISQMPIKQRCDICGEECDNGYIQSKVSYAEFQVDGLSLCARCYQEKNFPSFLVQEDFYELKKESMQQIPWTNEETIKLLEQTLKHQENWNEVAKHFSNRAQNDIIKRFLSLPYINISQVQIIEENSCNYHQKQKPKKNEFKVFGDTSNPLMKYIGAFKIQLDLLEKGEEKTEVKLMEQEIKQEEQQSQFKDAISLELQKINSVIQFLEEYEKQVQSEMLILKSMQKQNIGLLQQQEGEIQFDQNQ